MLIKRVMIPKLKILMILNIAIISKVDSKMMKGVLARKISEGAPIELLFEQDLDDPIERTSRTANAPLTPEGCGEGDRFFPDYEKCGLYHRCVRDENRNWKREDFECKEGTSFSEEAQNCTEIPCSEREPWPQLPPGFTCGEDSQYKRYQVPGKCKEYYTCIWTGTYFTYDLRDCKNTYFNEKLQVCLASFFCPQDDVLKPEEWACKSSSRYRHPHPDDCKMFYFCYNCYYTANSTEPVKCVQIMECPSDQIFNPGSEKEFCIPGVCPRKENSLPEGWKCRKEGDSYANPDNCAMYYKCVPCHDSSMGQWCYEKNETCPSGQFFDEIQKKCVEGDKCPQGQPVLPPGWNCTEEGEINGHPNDCNQYYTCQRCEKCSKCKNCTTKSEWCFETMQCPEGKLFDDVQKKCVHTTICPKDWEELPEGWECEMAEEKNVVPDACDEYYVCSRCDRPKGWCYTRHHCPDKQNFNDIQKTCVKGRCPQGPEEIPDDFNCTKDGDMHMNPQDCSRYYQCIWAEEYFTWNGSECPEGQNFDENTKECVSGVCPQDLIEIGTGREWKCAKEGELNVFPDDCSKYFECLSCSQPRKWCYHEIQSCPNGQNFDQSNRKCVDGKCPQDRPEITNRMNCTKEDDKHVLPKNCTKYYTCHQCSQPKGWCYDEHSCPSGHAFDEANGKCVSGRCPQLLPEIPPGWKCKMEGDMHAVPDNCSSYYTCIPCEDAEWCHNGTQTCPSGQTFNESRKTCVEGRCPQYPDLLPSNLTCKKDGDKKSNPGDCSTYYTCTKCPDSDGWCYIPDKCELGATYDDIIKKCVPGRCPQFLPLLPPDWKCDSDGEKNVDPKNCSKYYTCIEDEYNCPDAKFCQTTSVCPDGQVFDIKTKFCVPGSCPGPDDGRPVLPVGWKCNGEEEKYEIPTDPDCNTYYICYPCDKGLGWCYENGTCPKGQIFDDEKTMTCVTERCDKWPDKILDWMKCEKEEYVTRRKNPYDCQEYYECTECPDGGWCYDLYICMADQFFDEKEQECILSSLVECTEINNSTVSTTTPKSLPTPNQGSVTVKEWW